VGGGGGPGCGGGKHGRCPTGPRAADAVALVGVVAGRERVHEGGNGNGCGNGDGLLPEGAANLNTCSFPPELESMTTG
jgi:hypothetical protein